MVDASGRDLGPVRDLRVTSAGFEVVGLVVGGGRFARIAHAWGFAEGRATGPWILRRLVAPAVAAARFVPAERVRSWGPDRVALDCAEDRLRPLRDEVGG